MQEKGETLPTAISIDKFYNNSDDTRKNNSEHNYGKYVGCQLDFLGFEDENSIENPYNILIDKIKENFDSAHVDMFCSVYGLDGHKIEKGKDALLIGIGSKGAFVDRRKGVVDLRALILHAVDIAVDVIDEGIVNDGRIKLDSQTLVVSEKHGVVRSFVNEIAPLIKGAFVIHTLGIGGTVFQEIELLRNVIR
jgi:hypothetical protein